MYSNLIPSGLEQFHFHIYQSDPFPLIPKNPTNPSSDRQLMLTLIRPYRLSLRYKFSAVFAIIIRPAMYFRNFSFPVTMPRIDWCCPFQCISSPRIGSSYFSSFENGVEEIE